MRRLLVIAIIVVLAGTVFQAPHGTAEGMVVQPEITTVPSATQYLSSSPSSEAGFWDLSPNTQGSINSSTSISLTPLLGKTGVYVFDPGLTSSTPTNISGGMPEMKGGWITPNPFGGKIMNGTWSFNVGIEVSASSTETGYLGAFVMAYNSTSGNYAPLFSNYSGTNIGSLSSGKVNFINFNYADKRVADLNSHTYLAVEFVLNVTKYPVSTSAIVISLSVGATAGGNSSISYPFYGWIQGTVSPTNAKILLNGTLINHGSSMNLTVSPGRYVITASSPGYENLSKTVTVVSGTGTNVNINLSRYYALTFNQTGIPAGTEWYVNLSGVRHYSNSTGVSLSMLNGTYSYSYERVVGGDKYRRFVNSSASGNVTISGKKQAVNASFITQYNVSVMAYPVSGGTVSPVSGWYNASRVINLKAVANKNYYFAYWAGSGKGSYTGNNTSEPVTLESSINETALFSPSGEEVFSVIFTESGLPTGSQWAVTLNGIRSSSNTSAIQFLETNGSYVYSADRVSGYSVTNASGIIQVKGSNVTSAIHFFRMKYSVNFQETGLNLKATGSWGVSLENTTDYSSSSTISFSLFNGTYNFVVVHMKHYVAHPQSGSVVVSGLNVTDRVAFTGTIFSFTFDESGLPSSTAWSVTMNGTTNTSSTSVIGFSLPNGTYRYSIASATGYNVTPELGDINISGSSGSEPVSFSLAYYSVVFVEKGLVNGTLWQVNLSGTVKNSTSSMITFHEPVGNYNYSVLVRNYTTANQSGELTVSGSGTYILFNFSRQLSNGNPSQLHSLYQYLLYLVAGAAGISVAAVATYLYWRTRSFGVTEDIYVIHNDGRLLKHYATVPGNDVDEEIFSSTILAIKGVLKDATRKGDLKELALGDRMLEIFSGNQVTVVLGRAGKLSPTLDATTRALVKDLNEKLGDKLKDWNGDLSALSELDEFKDRFMAL